MDSEIVVAVLGLVGTALGTFTGILTSTKLSNYRIEQLEKRVEKHNSVVERTALIEKDLKNVWHSIDEIKEEIREDLRPN